LPSVTLGKEHSAKISSAKSFFAECHKKGTRQRASLPSVLKKALGKDRHSAKKLFAECPKKTLGKDLFSGSG
jgi:hypothetical protein